ncbi:MAG: AhpC/TSA family protein [Bacteroidaceae bacterium]|nr:AhpC/TSA family protein [Bacteroidaceae bacterium]
MKKLITIAAAAIALAACTQTKKNEGYVIRGTVAGADDGDTVSLIEGRQAEMEILQNAVVKDGTFTFEGVQDSTVLLYLSYVKNSDPTRTAMASLFLENAEIEVTMDPDSTVCDIRGTAANELWTAFARQNAAWTDKGMKAFYASIDTAATEEARQVAADRLEVIEDSITQFYEAFISEHLTTSVVGQYILASYAESLDDESFVLEQLNRIDDDDAIPALRNLRRLKAIQAETAVGQPYKDIMAETPDDNILAASNLVPRCKVLMIDFWASWCGPCRSEMPNVKAAYEKYHSQGFEILGVSLDNDLDPWTTAIEEMGMTWPQISDLEGWNSAAAAEYGVRAIPATVLIKDGIIVARNVRGKNLAPTIERLLSE